MNKDENKRITVRFPEISSLTIGSCFIRITIDTRHKERTKYPVCISFYFKEEKKTLYHNLSLKYSQSEYIDICKATGKGRNISGADSPYVIKKQLVQTFDEMMVRLRAYAKHHSLSVDSVRSFLGTKADNVGYFTDFWKKFNEDKNVGTRLAYEGARKSFEKICGHPARTYITADDIRRWEKGMTDAGLSKTSIGMYERACRAAWNEAVRRGLASKDDKPFGRIPQGATRKHMWLGVQKMTELYQIFVNHDYPSSWTESQTNKVHKAVGLFLFQYLSNGCNLADVARLRYNEDYFSSEGQMLTFIRKKTEDRSATEVVIPITEPLRSIINELAEGPDAGVLLFPYITLGKTSEHDIIKRVAQENKNILEGLKELTDHLGWSANPSGTWARHSFATNLSHASVPDRYISEAMGHAISGVTSRYIDAYPIELQKAYNSKLLNLNQDNSKTETVTLTMAEYQRLLEEAGKTGK